MFEPLRLLTLLLALALLAPLAFVFWQVTVHHPRAEARRRAELEAEIAQRQVGVPRPDGSVVGGVAITSIESIAFTQGTARWLSFFPHRWAGIIDLAALAIALLYQPPISAFTTHRLALKLHFMGSKDRFRIQRPFVELPKRQVPKSAQSLVGP